jgi:hypothetical protein
MRVASFYFMKQEPERIRAVAPQHASYWGELALGLTAAARSQTDPEA